MHGRGGRATVVAMVAVDLILGQPAAGFVPAALSFLVGVAGVFYLCFSKAASNLASIEAAPENGRRSHLRRVNGVVMLLLAVCIGVGSYAFDFDHPHASFLFVWLAAFVLLIVFVALALADVRLTMRLKESLRNRQHKP
jgi:hypothetical protein